MRADERPKLRNTGSFACMPTLNVGGAVVCHICLLVFLLLCDVCVCLVMPVAQVGPPPRQGRQEVVAAVQVARAIRVVEKMIADADGEFEVTVTMVRRRARLQCSYLRAYTRRLFMCGNQHKTK